MDFRAFSHGQIHSKIWLCENIEPFILPNSRLLILGSWYNLLGCMLLNRKPRNYTCITGVDQDQEAIDVANKICEPWMIAPTAYVQNICADANSFDMNGYNVVINCSVEHMTSQDWFSNVTDNSLVCIQSSNVNTDQKGWEVVDPNLSFEDFNKKFPLTRYFFQNKMTFNYENFTYKRYMIIGLK